MLSKKKVAIIGASYLQLPLIKKVKELGHESHVFAWKANDVGETEADYFYPISITEKDSILRKCIELRIDGICTIASDLASVTVNYVAEKMGLIGNNSYCAEVSTNKHEMRKCFYENGDPSPRSVMIESVSDLEDKKLEFPLIVKPVDRSGSRGITKVNCVEELSDAISYAKKQGFIKKVLVEEFAEGDEYSVEYITWEGHHNFLAITKKYTSGAPSFIERGHLEPAELSEDLEMKVRTVVEHALDSLRLQYGASHSEIKISNEGVIKIIEIGTRMGGDCIGSSLVELSTGFDYVKAVVGIALGKKPEVITRHNGYAGVRFIFSQEDIDLYKRIKTEAPELLVDADIHGISDTKVVDSSTRFGHYIVFSKNREALKAFGLA